jgi:hypothetical protein
MKNKSFLQILLIVWVLLIITVSILMIIYWWNNDNLTLIQLIKKMMPLSIFLYASSIVLTVLQNIWRKNV